MVKWFKILGDQYIGFWALGLILFALQEIPYMVMPFLKLENNPIMNMQESSIVLDISEKILGSLCIAIMTFVVQKEIHFFDIGDGICKVAFYLSILVLFLNFIGWGLYFTGQQSIGIMMFFIVILPPLYYALIGIWRKNWILLIVGLLFEAVHSIHIYGNLKA